MRGEKLVSLPPGNAREALRELLGQEVVVSPNVISDAAESCGAATPWMMMPTQGEVDPWATFDAKAVLDLVLSAGPALEGELIVVTDEWYPDGRVIPAGRLREVMESHRPWVGDDVVIIERHRRRVILVHHEGAYVHIFLP